MRDSPAIERNPPSDMMLKRGDRWIRIRHNLSRFLGFLLLCSALVLASYLTLQSDDWNLTRHLTRMQMQELHARKNGSLDGSKQPEEGIRQMRTLETGSTPVDTDVKMNETAIQMSPGEYIEELFIHVVEGNVIELSPCIFLMNKRKINWVNFFSENY